METKMNQRDYCNRPRDFFKHSFFNYEPHAPHYGTPTERALTDLYHLS